jgi:hypothetical protein
MLAIDRYQTAVFLDELDSTDRVFTFQTFDDSDKKDRRKAKVLHGTFDEHADCLIRMNHSRAGVFVMVNEGDGIVHPGNKTCRCNQNVVRIRAIFVDADGVPLEPILAKAPPPHIVVESSPGKWHAYWLTNDTKLEEFKARQQAIAQKFGTDPSINDLSRVMRLPGFYHQKQEAFKTRLVRN